MKFIFLFLLLFNFSNSFAYDWSEVKLIINNAIINKTLPGGVLLVGNKNEILFHQAFGTSDATLKLSTKDTLYDLA
jgi:hypothetical protein